MAAGGTAMPAVLFLGSRLFDRSGSFGGAASFFLGSDASLLDGSLLGLAILFSAALLFLVLLDLAAIFAAASFLERGKARFLGFAE